MKCNLIILILVIIPQVCFSQNDTCSYTYLGKYNAYNLTNLNKINIARIIGLSRGYIKYSDSIVLSKPIFNDTEYYEEQLTYFINSEKLDIEDYIIQSIFVNQYLFIILQKYHNTEICHNSYVLFQNGGGNSFCVLLFDTTKHDLIKKYINHWR